MGEALPKPKSLLKQVPTPPQGVPFHLTEAGPPFPSPPATTLGGRVPLLWGEAAGDLGY